MNAGHMTTRYIQDADGFTMMDVNLSHNSLEYPPIDYKPYHVFVIDWLDFDNDECHEIGSYDTKEEAETVYNTIIEAAERYANSLLRRVYSFNDYLTFQQEGERL